jgi:hypothetical protein
MTISKGTDVPPTKADSFITPLVARSRGSEGYSEETLPQYTRSSPDGCHELRRVGFRLVGCLL